jgi:alpha-galactosidase
MPARFALTGKSSAVAAGAVLLLQQCCAAGADKVSKGFNSWDSFKGTIDEPTFLAVSAKVAELLLPSGYDTVTVDEFWYPGNCNATKSIDAHGRAVVDETKFPSASGGAGFKGLSAKVHEMGLKFGIHVMHGVPLAAKGSNATVEGLPDVPVWSLVTADEANCPWNSNWYRIDMARRGAQQYLDSVYQQYADWGVDFIKNDCVFGNNFDATTLSNIQAARAAMDATGRSMVYSLSPGFNIAVPDEVVTASAAAIANVTTLYRITGDWHGWDGEDKQQGWTNHFRVANATRGLRAHPSFAGTQSFPDMDMLNPFADAESFRMQQTLWSIVRSPLIYGGDPRDLNATHPHTVIMTNQEVLAVADGSVDARELWHDAASSAAYTAAATATASHRAGAAAAAAGGRNNKGREGRHGLDHDSGANAGADGSDNNATRYVAFFKFGGAAEALNVTFAQAGLPASTQTALVTDLWTGEVVHAAAPMLTSRVLAPCLTDGSASPTPCTALYRVSPLTTTTTTATAVAGGGGGAAAVAV